MFEFDSGWNSVKKFIDVNQHLSLVEQGKHAPKVSNSNKLLNSMIAWYHVSIKGSKYISLAVLLGVVDKVLDWRSRGPQLHNAPLRISDSGRLRSKSTPTLEKMLSYHLIV